MADEPSLSGRFIIIVGAGPAGLYAAGELGRMGAHVALINRDLRPGGLGEYGVYPDKHRFKEGLRKQFRKFLERPNVAYRGGVLVGQGGPLKIADLQALEPDAILFTVGAQGTKSLQLPGEEGPGVYHAKDLVYHYNKLPPFSGRAYPIGRRVVIIGMGNVMVDVAHHIRDCWPQVERMTAVARRGPDERKYGPKDIEDVAAGIDAAAIRAEIDRVAPAMRAVGQNPEEVLADILSPEALGERPVGVPLDFRFLSQPVGVERDAQGGVTGLLVEDTTLEKRSDGTVSCRGTGQRTVIPCETVIFSIGDRVDARLGLPMQGTCFSAGEPGEDGAPSYRVYDADRGEILQGMYIAGWAREPSVGLVGVARKDATRAAQVIDGDLARTPRKARPAAERLAGLDALLAKLHVRRFDYAAVQRMLSVELRRATEGGDPEWRFAADEDMRAAGEGEWSN